MCYKNTLFIGIVIISILVISGCTEKTEKMTEEITPTPTPTSTSTQTKIVADDNSKSVAVNEHLQAIEQYMNNNENAIA